MMQLIEESVERNNVIKKVEQEYADLLKDNKYR